MIDTIILKIILPFYTFGPSWELQSSSQYYRKYVKNEPMDRLKKGYYPRLTGYHRKGGFAGINIEFSIPKLLFGDNLNEVRESDLPAIVFKLKNKLSEMGENFTEEELTNASVSGFHPSKNVVLSDGYTTSSVLKELSKININKKLDLSGIRFTNGESLQIYSNSYSLVFYDKVADLIKKEKRAIDKDQVEGQASLFDSLKKEKSLLEIFRFEVRLSKKVKMNSVLENLGFKKDPTFIDVFKKDVCQKIVRFYWDCIIKGENIFLFEFARDPKLLLADILRKKWKVGAKEAVFLVALDILCRADGGIVDLRKTLEKYQAQRSWYRISKHIKNLNKIHENKRKIHTWVSQIDKAFEDYEPFRLSTRRVDV